MVQLSLSRLYTLSLFVTGVMKHRVQIVEIIHGSAVTIQALHSDVILHVPDGVFGVILGNIHTDHWRFRHLVPGNECIISPICEFHSHGSTIQPKPKFRLLIPHILRNIEKNGRYIQVKFQMKQGEALQKAKHFTSVAPSTPGDVVYKTNSGYIEILTDHFTKFIVTAEEIECCCHSAVIFVFSRMDQEVNPTIADIRIRFANLLYEKQDYQQVNFYHLQMKLRKRNFFTSMCQEFCPQRGVLASRLGDVYHTP